ncbi:hypothetical protein B0H13DRAFT_1920532 [Mycena leptocephala]|nr:hypothetical protein B0H13DRAFT_1920532 [Mycena leptocephala]
MPPKPSFTQIRLNNITTCLTVTADTVKILASSLNTPFLEAISNTTQSLLKNVQTIKQNKNDCTELLEEAYKLLNAVLMAHVKSDTGGELPPTQQNHSKVKNFFHQGEMSTLLKECKAGLQQGFEIFQIDTANIMKDITKMRQDAEDRHKAVLTMIEALSDTTSFIQALTTAQSSTSISMLPSEPKIFHGRESELSDILCLFGQGSPRIAILGGGGMGKTSLARAVIHHSEIAGRYEQQRFFVACDSAAAQVELAALIGTHLGLKPGKDLTRPVIQHFSGSPPSLLILDNLETLWEPVESRANIEEFLSLLTGVEHLALVITMRGAERPTKVAWSRPFLQPLKPMEHEAAWQTFIDIADLILSTFKRSSQPPVNAPRWASDAELVQAKLPIDNILAASQIDSNHLGIQ